MQPADIVIVDPLDCALALSQLALQRFREKLTARVCSLRIMQYLVQRSEKSPHDRKGRESTQPDRE